MGSSPLIFSDVTFKMAAWRPFWIFRFPDSNLCLALNNKSKLQYNISSVLGKKPIDFQICHFQNVRLVVILDFLVSLLQFGFEFEIQTSAAHFLHVLVNRRLVILKGVELQSKYCPLIPISTGRGYPSRSLIYSF